jgi:hypothetical protein
MVLRCESHSDILKPTTKFTTILCSMGFFSFPLLDDKDCDI